MTSVEGKMSTVDREILIQRENDLSIRGHRGQPPRKGGIRKGIKSTGTTQKETKEGVEPGAVLVMID